MSRLLRSDLEAEAAALHAEARHIERELTCAGLSDDQLLAATRALVDPRDNAADALLEGQAGNRPYLTPWHWQEASMKHTQSGRFEVRRPKSGGCITLHHIPSGLACGGFSHIATRTFKAALEGVEEAEALLTPRQLELIDMTGEEPSAERSSALDNLVWALRECFPNGGWSR